jgi:hypothetical protein
VSIVGVCNIRLTSNFLTHIGWAASASARLGTFIGTSRCIHLMAPTSFAPHDLWQDLISHTAARSAVRPNTQEVHGIAQTAMLAFWDVLVLKQFLNSGTMQPGWAPRLRLRLRLMLCLHADTNGMFVSSCNVGASMTGCQVHHS